MTDSVAKISIHDFEAINSLFSANKQDPQNLRKIRRHFYRNFQKFDIKVAKITEKSQELIDSQIKSSFLTLEQRKDSKIDGASKLLFRTEDGHLIETVILRIATGRTSLCISSQVGCKFRCAFCATGAMGFTRNLTASEILDQIIQAQHLLNAENQRIKNIVYMGMGEPLDNFENVRKSIDVLTSSEGFNIAARNLMVSTTGLCRQMEELAEIFPDLSLALSLHYSNDDLRHNYMPINSRYTMSDLRRTLMNLKEVSNRPVMIEYILFEGLNDDIAHAKELGEFLKDSNTVVNLISYNAISDTDEFQGSDRETMLAFQKKVEEYGLQVTRRYSLGADIDAACGQLATKAK